jgi:AcrR family transcriptional regulator
VATTNRRTVIADAAVTVLAERGIRGLTHRAVDEVAGLAPGSTSYYFRTRTALLEAVLAHLVQIDRAAFAEPGLADAEADTPIGPAELDALADAMATAIDDMLTRRRRHTLARYACLLEAARTPELGDLLAAGEPFRAMATRLLRRAGAPDPRAQGPDLVACLDGLLFDRLAGAGATLSPPAGTPASHQRLRTTIRTVLRGMTGQ